MIVRLTRLSGVLVLLAVFGCGGPTDTRARTELQRAQSGPIEVVLLADNDALKEGTDRAVLEFRTGGDRRLVDVGTVTVEATMAMAGMAPMIGSVTVMPGSAAGIYDVETDLSMAGTWRLTVAWKGPQGEGTVTFPGTVR